MSLTLFYQKDLEANCGALRIQIAVLQEQNAGLQVQLEHHRSTAELLRLEFTAKETALLQRGQDTQNDLETKCAALRTELAVLLEQKQNLETQLRQSNSNANNSRAESTAKEAELLQRIEDARSDVHLEVQRSKDMKDRFDNDLAEARQRNADLESSLSNLQAELESNVTPCILHEKEIQSLQSQILGSAAENEELKWRARSITNRYETGDLVRIFQNQ